MAHDAALAQAVLLVHHRLEQHGGVQLALHEKVGLALPDQAHGVPGGLRQVGHIVDILGGGGLPQAGQGLVNQLFVPHQDGVGDALLPGVEGGLDGVLIPGGGDGHAGHGGVALLVLDELVKCLENHGGASFLCCDRGAAGNSPLQFCGDPV